MTSIIDEYVQYKVLDFQYGSYGASNDHFIVDSEDKGVRQVCVKLWLSTFARFSALCEVVHDSKQTIGRIAIESAINDAWKALEERGHGQELESTYRAILAKEGFYETEEGYIRLLTDKQHQAEEADK